MRFVRFFAFVIFLLGTASAVSSASGYDSAWDRMHDGPFVGADIWTNPLQDWRVRDGALECFVPGGERNAFLLTHDVAERPAKLEMEVTLSQLADRAFSQRFLSAIGPTGSSGHVGFRFGVRSKYADYRDSAFHGQGTKAGVSLNGTLFVGSAKGDRITLSAGAVKLKLTAEANGDAYTVTLTAFDAQGGVLGQAVRNGLPFASLTGGVGLTCHSGAPNSLELGDVGAGDPYPRKIQKRDFAFWRQAAGFEFRDWSVTSDTLVEDQERKFGPIAFALYNVNRGVLKLTAQMMPVAIQAGDIVALEIKKPGASVFEEIQSVKIDQESHTAQFRIENWDTSDDVAYRVTYRMTDRLGAKSVHSYDGTFSAEPLAGDILTVASLSCQFDLGYPHQGTVKNVLGFDPDMVIFSGDQIYEWNAGYRFQSGPPNAARLDYLRKWYQFGWAFRDLLRDRPSILITDDHDIFQGNIWGAGGRANDGKKESSGGYLMSPEWVNMVQRTQTSHLPDPYDATPVEQGIEVYYTDLLYGGVSFAILEDRKWKSGPGEFFSPLWIRLRSYVGSVFDARTDADVEGAQLLGQRQIDFLDDWSADWSGDTRMKAVVSSTLFTSAHTMPNAPGDVFDGVWAPPVEEGAYPAGEFVAQDFDSNGWPQTPRRQALEVMRKGFALHISGDTHFGTVVQYGIDDWNDAAWAAGSPAISSLVTRRWFPPELPVDYVEGAPRNLGNFYDGFGNPVTFRAVANPTKTNIEPVRINDYAPGYNILVFDTRAQEVEIQAWPRWVDPHVSGAQQFNGWPVTIKHTDNGYPYDGMALPMLADLPTDSPIVQVIDQGTQEIVYTVRLEGSSVAPRVFAPGTYTVRIFDGEMNLLKEVPSLVAARPDDAVDDS